MATTFVTNHVRQIGINIAKRIRHRDEEEAKRKMSRHGNIIIAFFIGGVIMTAASPYLRERTVWMAVIPLSVCFFVLLRSDLIYERAMLDLKPHGH